jgi:hypothetical protein
VKQYPDLVRSLREDGFEVQAGKLQAVSEIQPERGSERSEAASSLVTGVPAMSLIRVFISHSSKDREFVILLIDLIRSALNFPADQIRCTSVDGYRLPAGASIAEQLRREIHEAQVFIGVISQSSLQSLYMTFELGARWGAQKHLIPLLAPGVAHTLLSSPLADLNALEATAPAQLHQLVGDLAAVLGVATSSPAAYQAQIDAILRLPLPQPPPLTPVELESAASRAPLASRLSDEARSLIQAMVDSQDGTLMCIRSGSGMHVQVGQVEFTEGADRRTVARWEAAVRQLESRGLIQDLGQKGEAFELNSDGWDVAVEIGITPG